MERFSPLVYSLEGGQSNDTFCLEQLGQRWCVYYSERGERYDERTFESESTACVYLLEVLRELPEKQTRLQRKEV